MGKYPQAVEVTAPATVANLGPGFDILGMALCEPQDIVHAERVDRPGVEIAAIHGDGGKLSLNATRNTAGISANYVLKQLGIRDAGVRLTLHKGLPLASGLGSSAASAAAGAMAVNALFGAPMSNAELLPAAVEGEAAVSGRHADNVGPALLGGIVLVLGLDARSLHPLPVPENLVLSLVTPAVAVPTAEARAVLPKNIPLKAMVKQTAALGLLIHAIHCGDVELMGKAMEQDSVIEPARQHLMPGLGEVRAAARKCGAYATIISGAGPTLCSICDSMAVAQAVNEAATAIYEKLNLDCRAVATSPARAGTTWKVLA